MKNFKLFSLIFLFIASLSIISCGEEEEKEESVNCNTIGLEILDYIETMQAAQDAYVADPTPAKCVAYIESVQEYVDVVEKIIEQCDFLKASYETVLPLLKTQLAEAKADCNS